MWILFLAAVLSFSSETVKGVKKDFETFKQEVSVQLEETEKNLSELKAKAKTKSSKALDQTIKEVEATREELKAKLSDLKDDGKNGWKKMKAGIADSFESMNKKIQKSLKE